MRSQEIAQRLGCSDAVVFERLQRAQIPRSRRARISIDEARRFYLEEGWTLARLGERFDCDPVTVARHLREAGVQIRSGVESRQPPGRVPAPRSNMYRAYVLGLVWGDFALETHGQRGMTLSVKTSTTCAHQVALTHEIFDPFGPVTYSGRTLRASLDRSFDFLMEKRGVVPPQWISRAPVCAAFAAGYVDAEGSFGVYEGRGRFKVDSYDAGVLNWLVDWCRGLGIRAHLRTIVRRGSERPGARPFPKDLVRVQVNEALSLSRLVATLEPFARHGRRRETMGLVRRNVLERFSNLGLDRSIPIFQHHQSC